MDFQVSVKTNFSPAAIERNIRFGTAKGLTTTATQAQTAVINKLRSTFTIRSNWLSPSTPVGIKREIATPQTMKARVYTAARFLPLQDEGGIKLPYKNYLAMPADNGPLAGKKRIPENLRPRNLKNTFGADKVFELVTKSGTRLLCVRGFTQVSQWSEQVVPMYVLIKRALIKPAEVFHDPIIQVCNEKLRPNIAQEIQSALDGMKEIPQKV